MDITSFIIGLQKGKASGGDSGGGGVVNTYAYIRPTSQTEFTFEHNLGVVPDLVIAINGVDTAGQGCLWYGTSQKFIDAGTHFPTNRMMYLNNSGEPVWESGTIYAIDSASGKYICNATETSITLKSAATNAGYLNTSGMMVYLFGGMA